MKKKILNAFLMVMVVCSFLTGCGGVSEKSLSQAYDALTSANGREAEMSAAEKLEKLLNEAGDAEFAPEYREKLDAYYKMDALQICDTIATAYYTADAELATVMSASFKETMIYIQSEGGASLTQYTAADDLGRYWLEILGVSSFAELNEQLLNPEYRDKDIMVLIDGSYRLNVWIDGTDVLIK